MPRVRQAVILAGGRGTRLGALTDHVPKPMVAVNGRPFIAYVVESLRDAGINRILLLLGYLPDPIVTYFGDGAALGISIEYAISPVDDETGMRLLRVRDRIDDTFLLTYCDNYWPLDLEALENTFVQAQCSGLLTIYRNRDGYTRDNVAIVGGRIVAYDKSRTLPGLAGVDIGYGIFRRSVLELAAAGSANPSFEATVYPQLVAARDLGAFETDQRYYSIGSVERLPATAAFLRREKMVLLDRDGTLNKRMPRGEYVTTWHQWEWIPGALEALARLHAGGYRVAIITNQPGLARGSLTSRMLDEIHARMQGEVAAAGGNIEAIFVCPHGWDEGCPCRKPLPGLLFEAQRRFGLDLSITPFIGDDDRDQAAAERAGTPFHRVSEAYTIADVVDELCKGEPSFANAS